MLRGFELVFGVRVNLFKSKIYCYNLNDFVSTAVFFLACEIGSPSFIFLDILIGINPKRSEGWVILSRSLERGYQLSIIDICLWVEEYPS